MPRSKKNLADQELLPHAGEALVKLIESFLTPEYSSIAALSKAVIASGDKNSLGRTLRGTSSGPAGEASPRRLKLREAVEISNKLGIPIAELLIMFGFPLQQPRVPLKGRVIHTGAVSLFKNPVDYVQTPTGSGRGIIAIEMESQNTPLSAWHGTTFFIEETETRAGSEYDRLMVVKPAEARRALLGVLARSTGKHASLVPFGNTEAVAVESIEWSTPVLWIKCTG